MSCTIHRMIAFEARRIRATTFLFAVFLLLSGVMLGLGLLTTGPAYFVIAFVCFLLAKFGLLLRVVFSSFRRDWAKLADLWCNHS